jgi:hypothetical protein
MNEKNYTSHRLSANRTQKGFRIEIWPTAQAYDRKEQEGWTLRLK